MYRTCICLSIFLTNKTNYSVKLTITRNKSPKSITIFIIQIGTLITTTHIIIWIPICITPWRPILPSKIILFITNSVGTYPSMPVRYQVLEKSIC